MIPELSASHYNPQPLIKLTEPAEVAQINEVAKETLPLKVGKKITVKQNLKLIEAAQVPLINLN
jgi:hypothetical protein